MKSEFQNFEVAYCHHCNAALIYRPEDDRYQWVDGGFKCDHKPVFINGHQPKEDV